MSEGEGIPCARQEIKDSLKRVKCLSLKTPQKLNLISQYLVPHYLFRIVHGVAPITEIRGMDDALGVGVKNILHLPMSTVNGMIYARKRDGGIGFPRLETIAAASSLKSELRFLNSSDLAITALASDNGVEPRLRTLARSIRLEWPLPDTKTIDRWKQRRKQLELDPTLLKPCRFLTALKMRTDMCPTEVAMNRAVPRQDLLCRKCKLLPETLAHVIRKDKKT